MKKLDFKPKKVQDINLYGKAKVKIIVFFCLLLGALFIVQLTFANSLATDGEKLAKIEEEISRIEAENTRLSVEIAKESALSTLEEEASDLNFQKPEKIIHPR